MPKKTEALPWATHILTADGKSGVSCSVCGQTWKKQPVSKCPGLPVYRWQAAPPELKTLTQLAEKRLKPGGPVRGLLPYSDNADGYVRLYSEAEAVAMKPRTAAQEAAGAKAKETRIKNLTCEKCGLVMPSKRYIFRGICENCTEEARIKAMHEADSASVVAEVAKLLTENFILIDIETTDLRGLPVQICVMDAAGKVLLDTLINPGAPISPDATEVHGITDVAVADAPTFTDLYPALAGLLNGKTWLVYNLDFVVSVLERACRKSSLERLKYAATHDVMEMSAVLWGEWSEHLGSYKWIPLSYAAFMAGVVIEDKAHSARSDCLRTLGVLKAIAAMESEKVKA